MSKNLLFMFMLTVAFVILSTDHLYAQSGGSVEMAGHLNLPQVVKSAGDYKTEWLWTGAHFTALKLGSRMRTGGIGVAISQSSPLLVVPIANIGILQYAHGNPWTGKRFVLELDLDFNYIRNFKHKDNGIAVGLSIAF